MTPLPARAFITCVGFADILAATLPKNAVHFSSTVVITTPDDEETVRVAESVPSVSVYRSDAFHRRGEPFNKGCAIEESLRFFLDGGDMPGGYFAILDADVVMPAEITWPQLRHECLYSPLRRMMEELPNPLVVPPEDAWTRFPLHPQQHEWAGFFQLAHASAPPLKTLPWYPTSWRTAGGCDSEFQAKWQPKDKIRLPFEVLHIGPAGENWIGRVTPFADGTIPEGAAERRQALRDLIRKRRPGPDRFVHEKVSEG
jgi:hypothetical protein